MKLVSFRRGKQTTIGALLGDRVLDLVPASLCAGADPLPPDMVAFLEMGPRGLRAAQRAIEWSRTAPLGRKLTHPLRRVRLEAPVPCPRKLLALAGNYAEHNIESGRRARAKRDMTPRVFLKPPSTTVNRPGGPIVLGRYARWIDWEVELGIVLGRRARYVDAQTARRCIAGYTIVNDISERDFCVQKRRTTEDFDRYFDWLNGKWLDGFAPMGPCLVTADEIPDPENLRIRLALNGQTMQDDRTSSMIYSCPEIVAFISRFVTLEPGDVIATGTPAGIGKAQGIKLKAGDVLRAEIEGIGVLENPVVRETRRKT
jgi:2-keto-4-pentenoate hydratase/2-oxohepta-3-ene-1,7-dioic acid hydratase in catechol pathway